MKLSQLSYSLPKNLIANAPATPRDSSKLMVVDRETGTISHKHFHDLIDILLPTDVLVFNDTKVFPARIFGKRITGGKVEVLFLQNVGNNVWEILGKNIPPVGGNIIFRNFYSEVIKKTSHTVIVKVFTSGKSLLEILKNDGETPVPPYINSELSEKQNRSKYQTVYAEKRGSVAAPTAGLHFTKSLIRKIKEKNIVIQYVTLHVGLGTFSPIKENNIKKHKMHSEYYSVSKKTLEQLMKAKKEGKRIIAVGTTTTRVLETVFENWDLKIENLSGETTKFIYPPYKFKFVDALITNFHLPHSTLLAMISAFVSKPQTKNTFSDFKSSLAGKAYAEAIKDKYRFYSFGDAMLIN